MPGVTDDVHRGVTNLERPKTDNRGCREERRRMNREQDNDNAVGVAVARMSINNQPLRPPRH